MIRKLGKFLNKCILINLIYLPIILSLPCSKSTLSYHIIPSCSLNNLSKIIFSPKKECTFPSTENLNSIITVPCIKCEKGEHISFNFETKNLECIICPENTYSTGNNFEILGEYKQWTKEKLNKFSNKCFFAHDDAVEHIDCTGMVVVNNSYIKSTNTAKKVFNGNDYAVQLAIGKNFTKKGKLKFSYRKDTQVNGQEVNGAFNFFQDYLFSFSDTKNGDTDFSGWIEKEINVSPGYHFFMWQYIKLMKNEEFWDYSFQIKDIIMENVETEQLECEPCELGFSYIGASRCNLCSEKEYFSNETKKCEQCPENTINLEKNEGIDSCLLAPICDLKKNYYYTLEKNCDAQTNTQLKTYHLISEGKCIEDPKIKNLTEKVQCEECPIGTYKVLGRNANEYICKYCPDSEYTSEPNQKECNLCDGGFVSKIYYITAEKQAYVNTSTEIVNDEGEMSIFFNKKTDDSEVYFDIIIDNQKVKFNYKTESEINIKLPKGNHTIEINSEDVFITKVKILNSKNGGGYFCNKCKEKEEVGINNGYYFCRECLPGTEWNSNLNVCHSCTDNKYKLDFGSEPKCTNCPIFTNSNIEHKACTLNAILSTDKYKKIFNIGGFNKLLQSTCEDSSNLCQKNFYGPIKDKGNNLYYLSLINPYIFNSTDFSYKLFNEKYFYPGYIFQLSERKDQINTNSEKGEKLLINLGRKIEDIYLVLNSNKRGIIIQYNDGDICSENPNKNRQTFLFLNCEKEKEEHENDYKTFTTPKFIKESDCNYYFEWDNENACPVCLKNESNQTFTKCKKKTRYNMFKENELCIIRNWNYSFIDVSDDDESDKKIQNNIKIFNKKELNNVAKIFSITEDFNKNEYLKQIENDTFIFEDKIMMKCSTIHNFSKKIIYIIIGITIFLVLLIILAIICFCKVRQVNKEYEALLDKTKGSDQEVELGETVSKKETNNHDYQHPSDTIETKEDKEPKESTESK